MDDFAHEPEPTGPRRPPYRPPVGIPTEDGGRWRGVAISLMFHLFIVALIIVPVVTADVRDMRERRAAGAGPSGGGGGGRGGSGGEERIFYLQLAPGQAPSFTAPPEAVTAPPPPEPVVPPPQPPPDEPVPRPVPPPPPVAPQTAAPVSPADRDTAVVSRGAPAAAPIPGTGGGTGNDGTAGSGSGRGGGVGTGVGTGRGSGVGPGTGGAGIDSIYPPTLLTLALPPLQPPAKVRPYTLVALFDVDERGTTRLIGFNQTSDSRFNRQMRSVLAEVKFRPATRRDGTAVRDTGRFVIEYP